MFFDMDLLCRQRRGKFSLIWIAATRGIINLKKTEVEKVNLTRTCDEILKYVMSNSTSPRKRFSLYLSAQLIYGTVLVYQQQIKNFENDPENVKKRKQIKGKKTAKLPQDQELQIMGEQMLHDMPEGGTNIADEVYITLREETSTRININEPDLFGDEGQIDQQLQMLENLNWTNITVPHPAPIPAPIPDPIPVPDSVPIPFPTTPLKKRRASHTEILSSSPSKRRRTAANQHILVESLIEEHGSLSPIVPERVSMLPPPPPRTTRSTVQSPFPTELTAAEIQSNLQQPLPSLSPRPRNMRRRLSLEYSVLTPNRWHREQIYRVNAFEMRSRSLSREGSETSLNGSRSLRQDPTDIIAELLSGIRYKDEDIISVVRDIQEDLSLGSRVEHLRRPSDLHTRTLEPEPTGPTEISMRAPNVLEPLPELPLIPSPRLSRIPVELEPVVPEPQPVLPMEIPEPESQPRIPRVHTSTPVRIETIDTEAKRHENLLQHIRELFSSNENQPLRMEHLCSPLTKLNVARTFHGLLHLHAQQYVRMQTFPDSLEFKEIYPGINI